MKFTISSLALFLATTALSAAILEPAEMPPPEYWRTVTYGANPRVDDWKKSCWKACHDERITDFCHRAPYKDDKTRAQCFTWRDTKLAHLGSGHPNYPSTCIREICIKHWVPSSVTSGELAQYKNRAFTKSGFKANPDIMDWGVACGRACMVYKQLLTEVLPGYETKQWEFCSKAPWALVGLQDETCRSHQSDIVLSNWNTCAERICVPQWGMTAVPYPYTSTWRTEATAYLTRGYYGVDRV